MRRAWEACGLSRACIWPSRPAPAERGVGGFGPTCTRRSFQFNLVPVAVSPLLNGELSCDANELTTQATFRQSHSYEDKAPPRAGQGSRAFMPGGGPVRPDRASGRADRPTSRESLPINLHNTSHTSDPECGVRARVKLKVLMVGEGDWIAGDCGGRGVAR